MMLIKAQYLNRDDLLNYIAIAEEGVRQSGSSKSTNTKKLGGSLGTNILKADASRAGEVENTVSTEDHDYSRLARLIEAGHANPEDFGWLEALDPDNDFSSVGIGAFIEWECDIYIPEFIKILSNPGDLSSTLNTIQAVASSAEALGLDANEIPKSGEVKAMSTFLNSLDSFKVTPVVVGEDSSTDWRVVGTLDKQWIHQGASLDDRVRIIGKVKKTIETDKWYPFFSLPGMSFVNREERRRMEREGPSNDSDKNQFIHGPLLVLDYLAIYS
jgi:hypothetical protein